jgi:hypothetical protein
MADVHGIYANLNFTPRAYRRNKFRVMGFHQTETYRRYGDPISWGTTWHAMPVIDRFGAKA